MSVERETPALGGAGAPISCEWPGSRLERKAIADRPCGKARYIGRFYVRDHRQTRVPVEPVRRQLAQERRPFLREEASIAYVRRVDTPDRNPIWYLKWRNAPDGCGEVRLTAAEALEWRKVCRRSQAQLGWSPDPSALTRPAWCWRLDDALAPLRGEARRWDDAPAPRPSSEKRERS